MEIHDLHSKANASPEELRGLGNAYLLYALEECGRIRVCGYPNDARAADKLAGKIRSVLLSRLPDQGNREPIRPREVSEKDAAAAASQVILGELYSD